MTLAYCNSPNGTVIAVIFWGFVAIFCTLSQLIWQKELLYRNISSYVPAPPKSGADSSTPLIHNFSPTKMKILKSQLLVKMLSVCLDVNQSDRSRSCCRQRLVILLYRPTNEPRLHTQSDLLYGSKLPNEKKWVWIGIWSHLSVTVHGILVLDSCDMMSEQSTSVTMLGKTCIENASVLQKSTL